MRQLPGESPAMTAYDSALALAQNARANSAAHRKKKIEKPSRRDAHCRNTDWFLQPRPVASKSAAHITP